MKPKFMIDIDSTLTDTAVPIKQILYEEFGKDIPIHEWTQYDLSSVYGVDLKRIIDSFVKNQDRMVTHLPLYDGARDFLDELRNYGDVHIVTARGWFPNGEELTKDFFIKNDLPYDHLQIVGGRELKGDYAKQIDACAAFDDHLDHLNNIKETNPSTILVVRDQPWNRHTTDFARALDFNDFMKHIGVK